MAQSRSKRNRRKQQRPPAPRRERRDHPPDVRRRRIVIAFLVLVGLAGILAVSAPDDARPVSPAGGAPGFGLDP